MRPNWLLDTPTEPPAPLPPVEMRRRCPRCRLRPLLLPAASARLFVDVETVRCPRCKLEFENRSIESVPPTGIAYLDRYFEIMGPPNDRRFGLERMEAYTMRQELVLQYAWAVPSPGALDLIGRYAPSLVEIGAGGGYWAMLLRERGHDVEAFDEAPYSNYQVRCRWSEVERGGPDVLTAARAAALFLCWPPYSSNMAELCLARFRGDTVVYVGEPAGGCTANRGFFRALECVYREVETCALPQWPGLHDYLGVWSKR